MTSKPELSQAAAEDIDTLLDQSIGTFGIEQTEKYFESLENCLNILS